MSGTIISSFVALRDASVNAAWTPLVQFSRNVCLSVLSKIQVGQIKVIDVDGNSVTIGEKNDKVVGPECVLNIQKDTFWLRLVLYGDMV